MFGGYICYGKSVQEWLFSLLIIFVVKLPIIRIYIK